MADCLMRTRASVAGVRQMKRVVINVLLSLSDEVKTRSMKEKKGEHRGWSGEHGPIKRLVVVLRTELTLFLTTTESV